MQRITTTCTTCRDRRVKCGRERPMCARCAKSNRTCKYTVRDTSIHKFVVDSLSLKTRPSTVVPPSSGTWTSVIRQQEDMVKSSMQSVNPVTGSLQLWTLVEPPDSIKRDHPDSTGATLQESYIGLAALGDDFMISVLSKLPSREASRPFFEQFLLNVHPIVPVCNAATLVHDYAEFWDKLSFETSVEVFVRILAILYTGAASSESAKSEPQILSLLALYEETMRTVDFSAYNFTASSLLLLQGCLIMNTFRVSERSPFSSFGFLPQAIRSAQFLRLHFNKDTGNGIEPEVKRRIWWHLIYLDVESTISSGLQGIIRPDGYTSQLPSFFLEEVPSLDDEKTRPPSSKVQKISPMMVAMQGHWRWASQMQSWFERMPIHDEVVKFSRDMHELLTLLKNDESADWAQTYIKMQIDRAYCMLGLRFWQLDQFKGTDCNSEVVRTARSFLENYIHLATLSEKNSLCWFVPGFVQPLHALMILLAHLSSCPATDEEGFLSRHLIEKTMELRVNRILNGSIVSLQNKTGPCERRPDIANARYRSLWLLRQQVWGKNGWTYHQKAQYNTWPGVPVEPTTAVGVDPTVPSHGVTQLDNEYYDNILFGPPENILTGELLDPLQWEDWVSLSAGFFTT